MLDRNEVSEVRERFADGSGGETHHPDSREWIKVLGAFAVLFVVSVAAGVVLSGCGSRADSSGPVSANEPAVVSGSTSEVQAVAAAAQPAPVQSGLSVQDLATREGLPPDLSVSVGDTSVVPGQVVEFTVVGTEDVSQVALSDGRDEPTPFVREAGTNVWHAQYRMPLRPRQERLGVSVTARNDAERWRRVWVFLSLEGAGQTPAAETPVDNPDEIREEK